ncbi:TIGR01459 family HAD-type hydrolase [Acidisoma cellulosilytica]|uniref:TIGR01459 family HAD-type hydrolase n=1 Tax=Acidisoma cellulosilyticum TaxID=2802395 RepID=A0A964E3D4_9PROT|nr:TIGR01459 family HAD-type hydrolase [Acidisoma cellulosilyticum]MCB8880336.1 TIGR01459 family HAD-type hydrolase [Acidisoma cellulosilyticum]
MIQPPLLPAFDAVFADADAFLLDQFGTIHDGERPYPGAVAAMLRARAAGKRILILSNSGKRAAPNKARLAQLGFPAESYDGFLTSGEVVWQMLAARRLPALQRVRRVLVLSRGEDKAALAGLDLERTEDPQRADLVILLGSEADRIGLAAYRARLAEPARRGVPCLCGNPDRLMVLGDGSLAPAPGQIAEIYAEMGGSVVWVGKPHAALYEAAFAELRAILGRNFAPDRIWAVGDSLEHDIAGAAALGCRSILVTTGILGGSTPADIADEMTRWQTQPDAILPIFA